MYNYSYPTTDTSALPLGGTYNVFLACVAYNYTFPPHSVSCKK